MDELCLCRDVDEETSFEKSPSPSGGSCRCLGLLVPGESVGVEPPSSGDEAMGESGGFMLVDPPPPPPPPVRKSNIRGL